MRGVEKRKFSARCGAAGLRQRRRVIRKANDTEYGLTAYLYTRDLKRGLSISERLESGMVGLNRGLCPIPPRRSAGSSKAGSAVKAAITGPGIHRMQIYRDQLVAAA